MSFTVEDFKPLGGFMPLDVVIKLGKNHLNKLAHSKLEKELREEIPEMVDQPIKSLAISFGSQHETTVSVNKRTDTEVAKEIMGVVNDVAFELSLEEDPPANIGRRF